MKTLDLKLAAIHADPGGAADFILADAKDPDMAFGLAATGVDRSSGQPRSLADFRDQIREIVHQGLVDIMLMSASTAELLGAQQQLFAGSEVTPAVRGNDTSDIFAFAGSSCPSQPSEPFRTATAAEIVRAGADLALYSITPSDDAARDARALNAYRQFRAEAQAAGVRHFLEVFAPNAPVAAQDVGRYLNGFVARTLAGVIAPARPIFLKLPYFGGRVMEELVAYDPHLVAGVLGGSAGTTYDAFFLLADARRHGARAALFGRKINNAEDQLQFVRHLRLLADGEVDAIEATKSYHSELAKLKIKPHRTLAEDLQPSATTAAYAAQ